MATWIVVLSTGSGLPSRFGPLEWHIHEMLFGFVPAAIAGFLLTAVPNWTGRPAIRGTPLAALAVLWLLGRVACLWSGRLPLPAVAAVDLAFPLTIYAVATREVVRARNWRNLAMPFPILVLTAADALMYLQIAGLRVPPDLGWRLGLAAILILASAVGARIIPSFTQNWLLQHRRAHVVPARRLVDRSALGMLHAGLLGWAFLPQFRSLGVLLLISAALTLYRLWRWRGTATFDEPLLLILHVGYAWLIVGATLLGVSMLSRAVPLDAAVHAFTTGAIGTLVMAVMTRVSLGHTGRALHAGPVTACIYALVSAAAAVRVAAAICSAAFLPLIVVSAALWVASFALFALTFGPMLLTQRLRG